MSPKTETTAEEKKTRLTAIAHVVVATKKTKRRKTAGYQRFVLPVGAVVDPAPMEGREARAKRLARRQSRKTYLTRVYLDTVKINLERRYKISQTLDIMYLQNLAERAKRRAEKKKKSLDKRLEWIKAGGPELMQYGVKMSRKQRLVRFYRGLPKWIKIYLYIHERPKWLYNDKKYFKMTGTSPKQLWFIADMYRRGAIVFPVNAVHNVLLRRAALSLRPWSVRHKLMTVDEWREKRLARQARNKEWWANRDRTVFPDPTPQSVKYARGIEARRKTQQRLVDARKKRMTPEEILYTRSPHLRPGATWPQKWLSIGCNMTNATFDVNGIRDKYEPSGIFCLNAAIGETPVPIEPLCKKHSVSMHLANSGYRLYCPFVPGKLLRKTIDGVLCMYRVFENEDDRTWFNYLVENYDDVITLRRKKFDSTKYRKLNARRMYFERKWSAVDKRNWWVPPLRNWNSYNWLQDEIKKKYPEAQQKKLDLHERNPWLEGQKRFLRRWWYDPTEMMKTDKLRQFVDKEVDDTVDAWKAGELKTGRGEKKK